MMEKSFETCLIEHCAPTLAGIKVANLFCYRFSEEHEARTCVTQWQHHLWERGIRLKILKVCHRSRAYLIYVYREEMLAACFADPGTHRFLKDYGYSDCDQVAAYLEVLAEKLQVHTDFPHEIGLFLGYPLGDVSGFIENKGKNYRYSGCWKVYTDPKAAIRRFDSYKKCTARFRELYAYGYSILQLATAAC